jgi:hypothetical protein
MKIEKRALLLCGCVFALAFVLIASAQAAPTLYNGSIKTTWGRVMTPAWPTSPAPGETCPCPPQNLPFGQANTGPPVAGTFPFNVIGSNPAGFTVPAGALTLMTSGTWTDPPTPYLFSSTVFTGSVTSGTLTAGGGPGSTTFNPKVGPPPIPASQLRVGFIAGTNQFGGTLSMLGNFYNYFSWVSEVYGPGLFKAYVNFPLQAGHPFGATVMATGMASHTTLTTMGQPFVVTSYYTGFGFPWTTGTVTGIAFTGTKPTSTSAMGFDGRNAAGTIGSVQLVTPWITYYQGTYDGAITGTSVMLIDTPEPGHVLMLAAGLAVVGLLFGMRTHKR